MDTFCNCTIHEYAALKANLISKGCWNRKKKWWLATQYIGIINQQQFKKAIKYITK